MGLEQLHDLGVKLAEHLRYRARVHQQLHPAGLVELAEKVVQLPALEQQALRQAVAYVIVQQDAAAASTQRPLHQIQQLNGVHDVALGALDFAPKRVHCDHAHAKQWGLQVLGKHSPEQVICLDEAKEGDSVMDSYGVY